jgi:hypothetical protein
MGATGIVPLRFACAPDGVEKIAATLSGGFRSELFQFP